MSKENSPNGGPEDVMADWMKMSGDFWNTMFQAWSEMGPRFQEKGPTGKSDAGGRARATMDSAAKSFQALSRALSEPGVVESLLKGAGAMPEILAKMAQTGLVGFSQAQQKWVERAGRIGKSTEAYNFEDLDENAFRAWAEIYDKEFRQFFNVPQLGLTRSYQEKINRAVDNFNRFQTAWAEFLRTLYLPMGRSFGVMQEKIRTLSAAGELPEDLKTYYQMWIKVLEGHYMTLFQSPEYVQTLGKTLATMSEFSRAKNDVIEDALNSLPIPNQKDMDELYKEIYVLKKRIRALEKKTV